MKTKYLVLIVVVVVLVAAGGLYFFTRPKSMAPNISADIPGKKEVKPSETFIEYTDPAGFSFSYPDNLSIEKNEALDDSTYADLELFSKDVSGSLKLLISDTKLKANQDWVKEASGSGAAPKKLGNLNALEIKTDDRLMLGAIDQGVLFSIEVPRIEEEFWNSVYDKILAGFSFAAPESATTAAGGTDASGSEGVIFEGEEVVE